MSKPRRSSHSPIGDSVETPFVDRELATPETKGETLLRLVEKSETYDQIREHVGAYMGMRLFKPAEIELRKLKEFSRIRFLGGEKANSSKWLVASYKVLVTGIISRSVKEELSREQTLFTKLLTMPVK